jgi:hypothetical protein
MKSDFGLFAIHSFTMLDYNCFLVWLILELCKHFFVFLNFIFRVCWVLFI